LPLCGLFFKIFVMSKRGPIIIIEDDEDDKELFSIIFKELDITNKLIWFNRPDEVFMYLKTTTEQPYLIYSDVNLPKQSGIELKRRIDGDPQLRTKSIPFIFYSTSVNQKIVNEAYTQMTVQGFFQKGHDLQEIKRQIRVIHDYWQMCKHPNTT